MTKKVTKDSNNPIYSSSADFKDELDKLISRLPSMSDIEISAAKDQFLRKIEIALSNRPL
ncbi:hypothetical protein H8L32_13340 [Undibacterium sp. CY18W]|uniref:Uncharacterized protein n=1 Tax=Undibacterium hunanense TaxID=2762292 RepID=A0ABR6ZRG8_9BURK|nr:hypothetical protein [Undibacterium hunanense]MBC3918470.1 hypothetical protein [Undibacterium hunanense]